MSADDFFGSSVSPVAILSSLGVLPFLLFFLPAGVVDRLAQHKLMMWCDIGRLLLPASIPPATLPGSHLTFAQLLSNSTARIHIPLWSLDEFLLCLPERTAVRAGGDRVAP
ncbi:MULTISPECIES: hypothetical protein [Streptomyces]|uniref:Uncharacterized protein n=2 Tax=Streptomyces virginiae TaxID=1961 RepID=A0ABZ1T7K1_STRVG|nr:hypothetical protein [Streptomyces virginiae]